MLSLAHSGGWTGECERRGAGMCPAWRQVHLTRPASCTPARALQHSSQSLSKCAGATSTTISPPNRACSTRDRFPRAYMHVFHRFLFHKIAEQRSRARTHMPLASLIAALPSGTAAAAQGQINVLFELNGAVLLQLPCDVLSQMSFAHG